MAKNKKSMKRTANPKADVIVPKGAKYVIERVLPTTPFFQNSFVYPNGFYSFEEIQIEYEEKYYECVTHPKVVGYHLYDRENNLVIKDAQYVHAHYGFYVTRAKGEKEYKLFNNQKELLYTFTTGHIQNGCCRHILGSVDGEVEITCFEDGWFEIAPLNKPAMLFDPNGKLAKQKDYEVEIYPYTCHKLAPLAKLNFKYEGDGYYSLDTKGGKSRFYGGFPIGTPPCVTLESGVYMIGIEALITTDMEVIVSGVKLSELGNKRFQMIKREPNDKQFMVKYRSNSQITARTPSFIEKAYIIRLT